MPWISQSVHVFFNSQSESRLIFLSFVKCNSNSCMKSLWRFPSRSARSLRSCRFALSVLYLISVPVPKAEICRYVLYVAMGAYASPLLTAFANFHESVPTRKAAPFTRRRTMILCKLSNRRVTRTGASEVSKLGVCLTIRGSLRADKRTASGVAKIEFLVSNRLFWGRYSSAKILSSLLTKASSYSLALCTML